MTIDDVYAHIDAGFAAALDELACLVRVAGVGAQPTNDLAACAQVVLNSVCTSGLRAHLIEGYGPPAVYGERVVDPSLPTVLFYGHYDVQPAVSHAYRQDDPFEPTSRSGRMYGRGSSDNLGQHLAQLWAVRAMLAAHGELPVNVKVLIEGEAEIGSPHLAELVRDNRHLLAANLIITSDGSVQRSGTPQLGFGTRGQLGVELRTCGPNREAHSETLGGLLPGAAQHLVQAMDMLWQPSGEIAVAGSLDGALPPTPTESAILAGLPLDNRYVAVLADAIEHATGVVPVVVPSLGSSLPNFVFTDILGIPSFLVPYADPDRNDPDRNNPDQNDPAANEDFELSRFKDGMRIFATILDHVARAS